MIDCKFKMIVNRRREGEDVKDTIKLFIEIKKV